MNFEVGIENGIAIRPPSSALFCMSSADRYRTIQERRANDTSPFRFTITKNESLLNGFFSRIALTEVRFPWTVPNVSSDANTNKIQITSGNITDVITVPNGFYTPGELANSITQLWNSSYPSVQILLDFSNSQGFFALSAVNPVANVTIQPDPANTSNQKQLFDIMNWRPTSGTPSLVKFSSVPSMRWTDYIDIVANQLTYNQDLKDSSSQPIFRDLICRVYLDEPMISDATYEDTQVSSVNNAVPPITTTTPLAGYGAKLNGVRPFTIYRQFQTPKYIKWNKTQPIGQVQFEIYDDQGRALADFIPATSYLPGNDWNITMLVSEV